MMRKIIGLVLIGLISISPFSVEAAGTASTATSSAVVLNSPMRKIIEVTLTADAANATFPSAIQDSDVVIDPDDYKVRGWYLYDIFTNPGVTGPTNGAWDLDITDEAGWIVTQNLVDDRSSSVTQRVEGADLGYPQALSNWTISIADNTVNSASVVVTLVFTAN